MLAIRMQRTGRRGHAMFRVIVQDARRTPTSGKVVARLGSYDPHAKAVALDKEKATFYLEHGAQPSDRVALLLKSEGVKLPAWVKLAAKKESAVRRPDKRRSTRPADAQSAEPAAEPPAEETTAPEAVDQASQAPESNDPPTGTSDTPDENSEAEAAPAAEPTPDTSEQSIETKTATKPAKAEDETPGDTAEAQPADKSDGSAA